MNSEVLVKFKGDTKDLDTKTSKAESTLKGFSSGLKTAFKGVAVAVGTATVAVASLVKQSVDAYAEFEQLEGGLVSLFGEGSKEMQDILAKSENAYKDLTMSQNQYLNSFQSSYPLVNAGLSENADAIEYTNKVLKLSSDLFNTYGGSTEQYQSAINWALKGSFVYLDNLNLGIKGTQEGFVEAANKSGVLARNIENVKDLTNDEIIDVIQHYAEAYGVWDKTSTEATTTILGSLNMVKATWSNLVAGLSKDGADLDKLIDQLVQSILKFAENIVPVIIRAISSIAKALPTIVKSIVKELPGLVKEVLPPLIQAALDLVQSLIEALPEIMPVVMDGVIQLIVGITKMLPQLIKLLYTLVIQVVQALAEALPDLLPEIISAIISIIPILIETWPLWMKAAIQLMLGLIQGIIQSIPAIIEGLMQVVKSLIDTIKTLPGHLKDIGQDAMKKLGEGIGNMWSWIKEKASGIGKKIYHIFVELPAQLITVGINMIMGLWNGIKEKTQWIINKIKGFGSSVLKAIKGIFGVHSPSTEFEWIGKMNMVGLDKGMEDMKSQVQDTIDGLFNLQPNVSGSMNSTYSPQMNVIVQNNMEIDPLGQVVNQIKTFSGGAKNDYNWGASQ